MASGDEEEEDLGGQRLTHPGHIGPGVGPSAARDPSYGRISGASGKETRRQDGRRSQEAREDASLAEALADRTEVVELVVDKWFVDKGYGFGRGCQNMGKVHKSTSTTSDAVVVCVR